MNKIKEEFLTKANAVKLVQYFTYNIYYSGLDEPISCKIYPHEFEDLEELKQLKNKAKINANSLAQKLYQEQEFKKRQLNFFD